MSEPLAPSEQASDALVVTPDVQIPRSELEVRESGRTTLEIRSPALSKLAAIAHLRGKSRVPRQITYVGDECDTGNDREIQELAHAGDGVKCLHVSSPAQTGFFIATLLSYLQHGKR